MAKVIAIGQPRNDAERQAIAYLRDRLPPTCTILHNFELPHDKDVLEIDLAVLTPYCVYIVDVKGVYGHIDIYGNKWYPQGREPYNSPLSKARMNARILKGFITDAHPARTELQRIYVRAAVLLTTPGVTVDTHGSADEQDIITLNKCIPYFQNRANVPPHMSSDIQGLLHFIEEAIRGKARPRSVTLTFRDWQVEEKLGGNARYTEYRARHIFTSNRGTARLRIYRADPYQDEAARQREQRIISNAFRAVVDVPGHPNILNVRDFFDSEDGSYFVLVTEDAHGEALRQHIKKPSLALTFDQKLRVIRDVLKALDHAHTYEVIHRNLTPDAIIVSANGHARLASFEYARAGASNTSSIAKDIVDDIDETYQAPECYREPAQASVASDLFSAGLVFYELLTGETAFSSPSQVFDQSAIFPVKPSELKPDLPPGLDEWLQKLCAFEPQNRFPSAAAALKVLAQAITTQPGNQVVDKVISSSSQPQDKKNLPKEYVLGDRFVVQERLGQGGFATAYKVFDTLGEVMRVLKLVLTDRISVYQRLRQEYKTLLSIPEHPYVVKVIWADRLADGTPYIVFEYIDGLNVENLVRDRALTFEDSIKIAMQVAEGLAHLHAHGVYHQDIKPSNLLWTDQGIHIIDFNVAASDQNNTNMPGGTGRYIPPDIDVLSDLSTAQKIQRDIYALGVTLYECVTGHYPFDEPSKRTAPHPPNTFEGCEEISPVFTSLLLKAVAPTSIERFSSAIEFLSALKSLPALRKPADPPAILNRTLVPVTSKPNYNPFVSYLLTLYSQSQRTNAGTRGLDEIGEQIYVPTLLDKKLRPAILQGDFQLVVISGNAGDGKTAFIQQLAKDAERKGIEVHYHANGFAFTFQGRTFPSNYDGSQDEGEKTNNNVLLEFLDPFRGNNEKAWTASETRLIAINEGRLVDFLAEQQQHFPRLAEIVRNGLDGVSTVSKVAVINLNLRSVVAYMLVGTRDCDGIHELYRVGTSTASQQILDGFYFNAWMGGSHHSRDRLIALLREIDVGEASNPDLDRSFNFLEPGAREMSRFSYSGRERYDDELLKKAFEHLPREFVERTRARSIERHRNYVAMLRRRHYFECRDDAWQQMLPYQHFEAFLNLVMKNVEPSSQLQVLLQAVNRGEGLVDPSQLDDALALRVRRVERGTIQSYRLFDARAFSLTQRETKESTRFVEYLSQALYLQYRTSTNRRAELRINLDIYEMLMRLNNGYQPSPEELQGFYLSLMIFKNVLASAPYQEVLLTETGYEFYQVSRDIQGKLTLQRK
jgi:serine/threonine protein kinase